MCNLYRLDKGQDTLRPSDGAMLSDRDIWRAAKAMIQRYGSNMEAAEQTLGLQRGSSGRPALRSVN